MDHDEDDEKFFKSLQDADLKNLTQAADQLIDPVSKFMSTKDLEDLTPDDFVDALNAIDYASFIISGIMYSYGLNICVHEHDDDEENE